MEKTKQQSTPTKDTTVNSAGMVQINATVWLIERHLYPLDEQQKAWLRSSLVNLVESCFAFSNDNNPSWRAMYYDLYRHHNGEGLTDEEIEKHVERLKAFLIQASAPQPS